MNFTEGHTSSYLANDVIRLSSQSLNEQLLDKYTISNALALSVKLGALTSTHFVRVFDARLVQAFGKHCSTTRWNSWPISPIV